MSSMSSYRQPNLSFPESVPLSRRATELKRVVGDIGFHAHATCQVLKIERMPATEESDREDTKEQLAAISTVGSKVTLVAPLGALAMSIRMTLSCFRQKLVGFDGACIHINPLTSDNHN